MLCKGLALILLGLPCSFVKVSCTTYLRSASCFVSEAHQRSAQARTCAVAASLPTGGSQRETQHRLYKSCGAIQPDSLLSMPLHSAKHKSAVRKSESSRACAQGAVDKLIKDVAALATPGSLFHFDFLHLDVLEGRSAAVGYDNTAKASIGNHACSSHPLAYLLLSCNAPS